MSSGKRGLAFISSSCLIDVGNECLHGYDSSLDRVPVLLEVALAGAVVRLGLAAPVVHAAVAVQVVVPVVQPPVLLAVERVQLVAEVVLLTLVRTILI